MLERIIQGKDKVQRYLFATAAQDEKKTVSTLVRTVFDSSEWRVKRFRAGVDLVARPFEKMGLDVKKSVYNHYYDSTDAPFGSPTSSLEMPLIDTGVNSLVFLVEKEDIPPHVVKMDRRSVYLSKDEKVERVKHLKDCNNKLNEWFVDIPDFVVPSSFIISKLPFKNKEAIGIVQPFIPGAEGFFEKYTDDQLVGLFQDEPELRKDFVSMTRTVFKNLDESGQCMDFMGENNLCLTKDEKGFHKLKMIDSCDVVTPAEITGPLTKKLFEERKDRLTDLLQAAEDIEKN